MQQAVTPESCARELWMLIDQREVNTISGRRVDRSERAVVERYVRKTVQVFAASELVVRSVGVPLSVKHGDHAQVLSTVERIRTCFYKRLVDTLARLDRRRMAPEVEASPMAVLHYAGSLLAELERRLGDAREADIQATVRLELSTLARVLSSRLTRDALFFDVQTASTRIPDRADLEIHLVNAPHDFWLVSLLIE
ncbi:hypothetical protein OPU71_18550 [Niveibacterium sp. 24ML]|uniref:hypothetical protein n=1 Tax=Niveibacterium sp. 24ML TaxID=2985512 RepID=UPI00226F26EC|nr:hypothetical protein [Niveibacterium sp. 24ML]MCX9158127.1 hypothetical protein [Niveibacterium sp. 24ML]